MKIIHCPLINHYCDQTYNALAKQMLVTIIVSSLITKTELEAQIQKHQIISIIRYIIKYRLIVYLVDVVDANNLIYTFGQTLNRLTYEKLRLLIFQEKESVSNPMHRRQESFNKHVRTMFFIGREAPITSFVFKYLIPRTKTRKSILFKITIMPPLSNYQQPLEHSRSICIVKV